MFGAAKRPLARINSTSCAEIAREELTEGGYNIGRVIARPDLSATKAGNFQRVPVANHDGR